MSVYVAIHTSGSPSIGDVAEFGRLALALGAKPDGPLVTREGGNGALRCVLPTEILEKLAEFASDRHFLDQIGELHVVEDATEPVDLQPLEQPHSRACGIKAHDHGPACHSNCPTCHGKSLD